MIWEQKVERIAMLTNLVEKGNNKCMQYWPEQVNGDPLKIHSQFEINLLKEDVWPDFTRRQMEVSKKGSDGVRPVTQYHYTTWPDHGVPSHATALWRLFRKLTKDADNTQPIIIHCSAGVGRTGTLIAMDHLLDQANRENGIDVYACVTALRQSRMHMVQSVDQYKFLHSAVLEAHTVGSTTSPVAEFMSYYSTLNRQSSVTHQTILSEQTEMLNTICHSLSEKDTQIARLDENANKNRTEILPVDGHLLFLETPFNGRNEYINAVQVPGYKGTDSFIATQWPLEDTVVDFWRLVRDHGVQHIVLLEQLSLKNGFPQILPESGETENFGGIDVHCEAIEQTETLVSRAHNIKVLMIKKPLTDQSIIDVRTRLGLNARNTSTKCAVVCTYVYIDANLMQQLVSYHCRNGAELCGRFIAALNILDMVDAENEVDVFYGVQQIKVVRPEFVQSQVCFHSIGKHAF
ncbi:hypothetical protein CAPTEDRAFT_96484 [Capitella teleta]|uniref:protein-tyrosine-phosphatase n=1 Tax=Capitella teleta TaxID=283909 RepID=R7VE80_CAPTE|nr:hypothetical protein CAPTEDRAFT_96484 [Capitella teleta]|eukprot:ELU16877.1 hypothetical protein CAPTEDRAFT_96484 [Capitella teleta]